MATKKVVTKKSRGGGSWEKELAEEAEKSRGAAAAAAPKGSGAPRLGIRGGVLTLGGKEVKGNELECVIVDFSLENAYYSDAFDPDNPVPPSCYALGRDEESMEPSGKAEDPQADACTGCPQNEFGSADVGRGKACKNSYRMVLLVPDEDEEEPQLVMLTAKLTVFKDLNDYIDSCINDLRRPYWAVLTKISTAPDRKSQFRLEFEVVDKLDKGSVDQVKVLRESRTDEMLAAEFPSRESVEANRAARRDNEKSKQRQTKMTRKGVTSKLENRKPAKK